MTPSVPHTGTGSSGRSSSTFARWRANSMAGLCGCCRRHSSHKGAAERQSPSRAYTFASRSVASNLCRGRGGEVSILLGMYR
eukprot:scaffold17038_cov65-Isochrysis_galbana.AAC.1